MASNGKIEIEKINGQSFELWKLKMEDLLVDKDQRIMVYPGTKPMRVSDEEWKKLDWKAKSTIQLYVSDSVLLNVSGEATAKALWDKLGTLYQSKPPVNKLFIRKKLYNLRMKYGDSVIEHLNAFNTVVHPFTSLPIEWFFEYEKYDGGDVFLGDERKARIIGRIKVKLKLQDGRVRTLPGVLHIPALARNLIFISKVDDVGVKIVFEKDTWKMVWEALVLMWGVQIGTLYKLQGSTVINGCNSFVVPKSGAENLVVSREKTMLWHHRLGHIGEKGLLILHGKGMVESMSNRSLDFDFSENFVYGKQNQVSFPSGSKRAKQILELVHNDVFEPVKVPSLGKSVYYVSFIDDFSRTTWIYFLKNKSEVFDRFKEFKALVENQT
eukprot:PITA_34149